MIYVDDFCNIIRSFNPFGFGLLISIDITSGVNNFFKIIHVHSSLFSQLTKEIFGYHVAQGVPMHGASWGDMPPRTGESREY